MSESSSAAPIRIGLLSDTHGCVPPALAGLFAGVSHIVHAGDIGPPSVLALLARIAPVVAVRGNCDRDPPTCELARFEQLDVGGHRILVTHDRAMDDVLPELRQRRADILVFGHTHRPDVRFWAEGLIVNPGSAGSPRYRMPPTAGILVVAPDTRPVVELWDLCRGAPLQDVEP